MPAGLQMSGTTEDEKFSTLPAPLGESMGVKIARWIRSHPLLLVILGNCLFSWGIWNCWVGYGEDTGPIATALANAPHLAVSRSLFVDLYTMIFAWITSDPLVGFNVMRFLVSFETSVGLFLVLSRFVPALKVEAVLVASLVWIASRLNAPAHLFTNISSFTFGLMLFGIYFLFSKRRFLGLAGFLVFSLAAISQRPEWLAPFLLISLLLVGEAVWKVTKGTVALDRRVQFRRAALAFTVGLTLLGALLMGLTKVRSVIGRGDDYLLFGLGQCYASFYKAEHPEQAFDPMTEYQWLLDKTFGKPRSFLQAIRNNPSEAVRYFRINTLNNLRRIPEELLSTRSGRTAPLLSRPHSILLFGVLIAGPLCAVFRLRRRPATGGAESRVPTYQIVRKVIVLAMLCSGASVAIVMLVGSPRYWISTVPILYLGIAWCCDALMRSVRATWFDLFMVLSSFVFFCRPNFLDQQGGNVEVKVLRRFEALVKADPVIGAIWADPFVVYAFRGKAKGVSASEGIKAEDVTAGRYDILIINRPFRASKTWADQQVFFEHFESNPEQYGFRKYEYGENKIRANAIYYRPLAGVR